MSRPDRQRFLDRVEAKVSQLRGGEFSEEQLRWAVLVTAHNGWPLRDSIVLREARRRAEMETGRAGEAWTAACEWIRERVPTSTFELWIAPCELVGEHDGRLVLTAPTGVHAWTSRRYTGVLSEAVRAVAESLQGVRFAEVSLPVPAREAWAA